VRLTPIVPACTSGNVTGIITIRIDGNPPVTFAATGTYVANANNTIMFAAPDQVLCKSRPAAAGWGQRRTASSSMT
jgi:hypothetical protein